MSDTITQDLLLAAAAVSQGSPCVSSYLAFGGVDLRQKGVEPSILQGMLLKHHDCIARAALKIYKDDPLKWWRLIRPEYDRQMLEIIGDDATALLADRTIHDFIERFRQWSSAHLSAEQQQAFAEWVAADGKA